MKRSISLRRAVILFIVATSGLLIVSYSILLSFYMTRGLNISTEFRLKDEAQAYDEQFRNDPETPLPQPARINVYTDYVALPDLVRSSHPEKRLLPDSFVKGHTDNEFYYLYTFKRSDGKILYFLLHRRIEELSKQTVWRYHTYHLYSPIIVGLISIALVIALAVFILRRVAQPVEDLRKWAVGLDMETLDSSDIEFKYQELNEMADLFRSTLRRLGEGVEREKRFQKFASHELRTPIAIMQNNLELLECLGIRDIDRFKASYGRMDKAVKNMRHLTTALLWVSREEKLPLQVETIALDCLISDVLDENAYLLVGKGISLKTVLPAIGVNAPRIVAHIILSNVIRNAFQHTYEGEILISLEEGRVHLANTVRPYAHEGDTECYGLGLQLTSQLVRRIGWNMEIVERPDEFVVDLSFS